MATLDETPTFNLKAVIQETALKPDTLRAWERRYGLPQPQRTPGGHRVYSQRDIDTLKWLIARQEEGLSISRAVALWRQLEEEGQDPLEDPTYGLQESPPVPSFIPAGAAVADLRDAWLAACTGFHEQKADHVLSYALALYPAETVCFEILLKGLAEVGDSWYRGEATVQQEHFVSELSMRRLEGMVAATPAPTRPGRVLVGCAPEEAHSFVPLLITFMLKQRGWDVVYLGARVPLSRMESTISTVKPHLVILTAQQLSTAASLLEIGEMLQREKIPFAFGGRIFSLIPDLHHHIPGYFLGEQLEALPQAVEQLLTSPPPLPPTEYASEEYRKSLVHYLERQTLIEAELWQTMGSAEIPSPHLTLANDAMARNIIAALTLGDIDFLCTDIRWVEGLLENHRLPRELLRRYLKAYQWAALKHLDGSSEPVVTWLAQLNEEETETKE